MKETVEQLVQKELKKIARRKLTVFVVVESVEDGDIFTTIFLKEEKAIKHFKAVVKANCGERNFDGESRQLSKNEIDAEVEEAIEDGYSWSGWDTKVEMYPCDVRK